MVGSEGNFLRYISIYVGNKTYFVFLLSAFERLEKGCNVALARGVIPSPSETLLRLKSFCFEDINIKKRTSFADENEKLLETLPMSIEIGNKVH